MPKRFLKIRLNFSKYNFPNIWQKILIILTLQHTLQPSLHMSHRDKYKQKQQYQFQWQLSLHITLLILPGINTDANKTSRLWQWLITYDIFILKSQIVVDTSSCDNQ
jgi:hypothetical protein